MRRLEQEQHAQAWGSKGGPSASAVCASLEVPKPDVGSQSKAMIGICQALTVWMAACTGTMQRVAELGKQGTGNGIHAQQLLVEVKAQPLNQTNRPICFACHDAMKCLHCSFTTQMQSLARTMLADANVYCHIRSVCCGGRCYTILSFMIMPCCIVLLAGASWRITHSQRSVGETAVERGH